MSGLGQSMTGQKAITSVERERQALELRKAGWSFQQIADHLGYEQPAGAYKAVKRALHKVIQEPAEELKALMLEQHRTMLKTLWPAVIARDYKAIDRAIRILAAISDLEGLNAPVKVDVRHIVAQVAAEFGLQPDESEALIGDVTEHLATNKAAR